MTMNTNTTTTTRTAKTLAELTAERRADSKATFTEYIKANRNNSPFFADLYTDILYTQAEKAVYIALRARHEKSGLNFLAELQNAQSTDTKTRNRTEVFNNLADLEQLHESHRKGQAFFTARANRLTLSDHERALAYTLAQDFKTKADTEQQHIDSIYNTLEETYSDRADLTQTAILAILDTEKNPAPITATILAEYGATTAEELTEEERAQAQSTANFRAVINSVGRAINTLTHPDANNRTTTKAEPITLDEVANYIIKYGNEVLNGLKIPHTAKRTSASQCYITIEERNTKTQQGYYKVYHYATIAPYQYIEDYSTTDENGENDIAYLKSYNPFVSNFADIEHIEELCNRSNLTDRQRLFLAEFAKRCRFDSDFYSVRKYAFERIGIHSDRTQRDFFAKLRKALTANN